MFFLISSATSCPPATITNLVVEALIAIVISIVFDVILKNVKSDQGFKLFLCLFPLSFIATYIYQFTLKKTSEEFLIASILIVCGNFLTQFISASLFNQLTNFSKLQMCIASLGCFGGIGYFGYNFIIAVNFFAAFIGLVSFLISIFWLVKYYRNFIPL